MDEEAARQLRDLGVPEYQVREAARAQADSGIEEALEVPAYLFDAVRLFQALRRQWLTVVGPSGRLLFLGLNNVAIEPTMRLMGMRLRPQRRAEMFGHLMTMESEALTVLNDVNL